MNKQSQEEPKWTTQNETDLTVTIMVIGGIVLTIAAIFFLVFSSGLLN